MKEDVLIDYAMPLMQVERMAKKVHDLCLEHKYEEARELAVHLTAESRILTITLRHMSDKEKPHEVTKEDKGRHHVVRRSGKEKHITQ